jgi:hypothetical protein
VTWLEETTVVDRGDPFQFTTAPATNPVPFTVRVKPELPGFATSGTSGKVTNGAGLFCASKLPAAQVKNKAENKISNNTREWRFMGKTPSDSG